MSDQTYLVGELSRLKVRIEKLEKALAAKTAQLERALEAKIEQHAERMTQADADMDLLGYIVGRNQNDLFDRLEAVERWAFPGVSKDYAALDKLLGRDESLARHLDRRKLKRQT